MKTVYNMVQKIERLRKESVLYQQKVNHLQNPKTPQQKRALTLATKKLNQIKKDLSNVLFNYYEATV